MARIKDELATAAALVAKARWKCSGHVTTRSYMLKGVCGLSAVEFVELVSILSRRGSVDVSVGSPCPVLVLDGYKYWSAGGSLNEATRINRQKVYGEFDTLPDPFKPHYSMEALRIVARTVAELFKGETFYEVGCGDGLFLSELGADAEHYRGCDPSVKAIEGFRKRFPERADAVICKSFEQAESEWHGKPYVILADFGAASYIEKNVLRMLSNSNMEHFLMFYRSDYVPEQFKGMHHFRHSLYSLKMMFPTSYIERTNQYVVVSSRKVEWKTL